MNSSFASRFAAVAAAALVVTSASVLAEDGHRFHRGHGGGDFALGIAALKGQLNLNTSQQQMWDNAVGASKAARATGKTNFGEVRAAMAAELAKPEPDLAAVAGVADGVQAKNQALRHQVRDAWLAVYATFSPAQKAVVRDALAKRMARMENRHTRRG